MPRAPESEIAHIVESLLGETFELGYRLSKPYVEVKVWTPLQLTPDQQKRLDRLAEKLKPWLVGRDIKRIHQNFHQTLSQFHKVFVVDHLTSGLMLEKLKEDSSLTHIRYQCFEQRAWRYFNSQEVSQIMAQVRESSPPDSLFIWALPPIRKIGSGSPGMKRFSPLPSLARFPSPLNGASCM